MSEIARTGASVGRARALAQQLHEGQQDKAGRPYIDHPARVAAAVHARGGGEHIEAAAWLHDTVEDTPLTLDDLKDEGFSPVVIDAVDALTRWPNLSDDEYFTRVKMNYVALQVKCADIADNADPARLALLNGPAQQKLTQKYEHAREALGIDRPEASGLSEA
jgi:Guanosine polyphosphate pyrophosphohydrolases/synthetases